MPDDEGMPIQIAKPELNMSKIGGPEAVDIHLSAGASLDVHMEQDAVERTQLACVICWCAAQVQGNINNSYQFLIVLLSIRLFT